MIETPRLLLRPFHSTDATALAPIADGMGPAGEWLHTQGWARQLVESFMARPPSAPCLAICSKDGTLIGATGFSYLRGEPVPELGYWLGKAYWGQGFGHEAASAITAHAFGLPQINELLAECRIGNEASRRILTKLGFSPTGTRLSLTEQPGKATLMECFHLSRTLWLAQKPQPGQIHP